MTSMTGLADRATRKLQVTPVREGRLPQLFEGGGEFRTAGDAEFLVHARQVVLYRFAGQEQSRGDLRVGPAGGGEQGHVPFLLGEDGSRGDGLKRGGGGPLATGGEALSPPFGGHRLARIAGPAPGHGG